MPAEPPIRRVLDGARILVTRPEAQAGALSRAIDQAGGAPLCFPVIAIEPPRDADLARVRVAGAGDNDVAVFVSANAVAAVAEIAGRLARAPDWPPLVAVGAATRRALERHGLGPVVSPVDRYDTEALLALDLLGEPAVSGRRIVVFKGEGGRDLLASELTRRGAELVEAPVYRRALPAGDRTPLRRALEHGRLDAVVVTSAEAAENLFVLAGRAAAERLAALGFVVVSERVAERVRELGACTEPVVAARAGDGAIIEALGRWWSRARLTRQSGRACARAGGGR